VERGGWGENDREKLQVGRGQDGLADPEIELPAEKKTRVERINAERPEGSGV